jgi:hypothetical protein
MGVITAFVVIGGLGLAAFSFLDTRHKRSRREAYIRTYMFPPAVFEKFHQARPALDVKEQQLVARGLRQFFLTYHKSNHHRVAMPSQVVDDLWHEFILFTRDYQSFCRTAFGEFLHHTPAVKLGAVRKDNEGLRRVWWFACLEENINPRKATRLPLLFAIDRKLGIGDGFVYSLDCRRAPAEVAQGSTAGAQCAEAFGDSSIDGSTDGLGCSGGSGGTGSDGDGGSSGCGGGCGGD